MNRNPNSQIVGTDPGADLTEELQRPRQEAGKQGLPDFTGSTTTVSHSHRAEIAPVGCHQASGQEKILILHFISRNYKCPLLKE